MFKWWICLCLRQTSVNKSETNLFPQSLSPLEVLLHHEPALDKWDEQTDGATRCRAVSDCSWAAGGASSVTGSNWHSLFIAHRLLYTGTSANGSTHSLTTTVRQKTPQSRVSVCLSSLSVMSISHVCSFMILNTHSSLLAFTLTHFNLSFQHAADGAWTGEPLNERVSLFFSLSLSHTLLLPGMIGILFIYFGPALFPGPVNFSSPLRLWFLLVWGKTWRERTERKNTRRHTEAPEICRHTHTHTHLTPPCVCGKAQRWVTSWSAEFIHVIIELDSYRQSQTSAQRPCSWTSSQSNVLTMWQSKCPLNETPEEVLNQRRTHVLMLSVWCVSL